MVWINEIPWHEMNVDDELTLRTAHPWARELETRLRRTLYQWRHMPGDMVVSDFIECPAGHPQHRLRHPGGGRRRAGPTPPTTSSPGISTSRSGSRRTSRRSACPSVTHDEETTAVVFDAMQGLFRDIMPVRKVGQTHIWFTPWDYLIRWWGLEEAMVDLVERPEMVNAAVERMVDAWMVELDQFEALNLLSLDCNNTRVGSGGFGYTWDMPGRPLRPGARHCRTTCGAARTRRSSPRSPRRCTGSSPFGTTCAGSSAGSSRYYGCCEPLDRKIDLLRKIPNLRKISVSPWNNFERVIREIAGDYVFSFKPSPAIFVDETWSPEKARAYLTGVLDKARGTCHVEIIMKDVSTVRYRPQNLWDWARVAMEVVAGIEGPAPPLILPFAGTSRTP